MTLDLSVRDFNTLGESGGLFFVGTNPTQLQQKYGLAKWFSLPQQTITLEPGQTQTIEGEILNQGDLSPGGHYGALLLTAANSPGGGSDKNKVTIQPVASSLMFVTKTGGDTHRLDLSGVNYKHSVFSLPSAVTLRFKNDGNTHVVPRGVITITDSSGKVVAKGAINENSNIILPESYRQIYVPLTKIGGANSIGQYQLKVDFRFDGFDQYREYRTSFEYVPKVLLILLIIALAAAVAVLVRRRPKRRKK